MGALIVSVLVCTGVANAFLWVVWGRPMGVELDRVRRQRDEYVDELHALRLERAELVVENGRLASAEVVATLHQRMRGQA
ncbi:hypothetical protein ACQP2T_63810 (plasmid) [Nonomuraea sp. CA-143628]|uniref:hypothetical protein n=1 Tax=Nonomuraea sp. CA-143628 TaxID=3239997 RepID=UPI003D94470E